MKTITLANGVVLNAADNTTATNMIFEVSASEIGGILAELTIENMRHVVIKDENDNIIQDEHRVVSTNSASISGDFETTVVLSVVNRYLTKEEITEERLDDLEDAVLDE